MKLGNLSGVLIFTVSLLYILLNHNSTQAQWLIQTVDGDDASVGEYPSLALDSNDNPHISYHDGTNFDLKYSYRVGSNWQIVTVDSIGSVGWTTSLALDNSDKPRISYVDGTNFNLKYAWCDANCGNQVNWQSVPVDSDVDVWYTSLALDTNDNPRISYADGTNFDLKYAWCESGCHIQGNWQIVTVDSIGSVGFWYTSLALDNIGNPHISYYDDSNDDLKYAWCESDCHIQGNWQLVLIDPGNLNRSYTSIAIGSNGTIHISYTYGLPELSLKYAWCQSDCHIQGNWQLEPADITTTGYFTSLALDNNNNPHISYRDHANGTLKYVYKYGGIWNTPQTVNCSGNEGLFTSLALDNSGNPYISYFDNTNKDLKFAFTGVDSDSDGIADDQDNCQNTPNGPCLGTCYTWSEMMPCTTDTDCDGLPRSCSMNQEDTYPPDGNDIGDACDCECDFNCDGNVDADDVTNFLTDFGRSPFFNPCTNADPCNGDCECDTDVDSADIEKLLEDFGRSPFFNPCPPCVSGDWCSYP